MNKITCNICRLTTNKTLSTILVSSEYSGRLLWRLIRPKRRFCYTNLSWFRLQLATNLVVEKPNPLNIEVVFLVSDSYFKNKNIWLKSLSKICFCVCRKFAKNGSKISPAKRLFFQIFFLQNTPNIYLFHYSIRLNIQVYEVVAF